MDWIQSLRIGAAEELLSIVGIALLVGSAWGQTRRDARAITWLAVLTLVAAAVVTAPALWHGVRGAEALAFNGLLSGDAFAAFAKLLIYVAAAASLLVAPAFFEKYRAMRSDIRSLEARLAATRPAGDAKLKIGAAPLAPAAPTPVEETH